MPGAAATAISSSLPTFLKRRCAVGRSKPASVAPPIEIDALSRTMPETLSLSTGPSAWTPTTSPILKFSSFAVPLSITTSFGPGQSPSTRASGLNGDSPCAIAKPRFGAPPLTTALPSRPISVVESLSTLPSASCDAVDTAHRREDALGERRRGRAAAVGEVERRLAGDDRARAFPHLGEDRVEGRVDRVGEDVRAADHRDAEHDRERGQRRAELAPQQALEREPDHAAAISFSVSRISACVAPATSLTIWPSARKRIRSAIAAARGSCVTITVVCP